MSKDLTARETTDLGFKVFDADSGEHVLVTAEMQMDAIKTLQQATAGLVVTSMNVKKLKDERLYLCFTTDRGKHYNSWREFVEDRLTNNGIGYATAQRMIRVADNFDGLFQRIIGGENESSFSGETKYSLNITKLDELTRLPCEIIEQINDSDELVLPDGRVMTVSQLMDMKREDLIKEVKELNGKKVVLEEGKALAEEKAASLQEQVDSLADKDHTVRMVVELSEQLDKLQGEKISKDSAEKYWKEFDKVVESAFIAASRIPQVDDENIRVKIRQILSGTIARANTMLTELNLTYMDQLAVNTEIPENDGGNS